MGLADHLRGGVVCVDTQVIIYLIEKHPVFSPPLQPLAVAIQSGTVEVWASELVIMECLTLPFRQRDTELMARFNTLFSHSKLRLAPISRDVLQTGARLRADLPKFRTPDAIHAATALKLKPTLFLTNDTIFSRVVGIKTMLVSEFA